MFRKLALTLLSLINKAGYQLIKTNQLDFIDQSKLIENPNVILDIGSNLGQTLEKYLQIYPKKDFKYYSIEAIPILLEKQKEKFSHEKNVIYANEVLSNDCTNIEFKINQTSDTSSILETNNSFIPKRYGSVFEFKEMIKTKTTTLDLFCKKYQLENIDILKIDVQGAELKVLQGADDILTRGGIKIIYCECLFLPFYNGQSFIDDIIIYLNSKSYKLFQTYNHSFNFKTGRIMQCDAIFVHTTLPIEQNFVSIS